MGIVLICLSQLSGMMQPAPPSDPLLSAARNSYEANRSVLSFGMARFRLEIGYAGDFTEAELGNWETRFVAEGIYAFDGRRVRYESVFPAQAMVADRRKIGPSRYNSGPTKSVRLLTNGTVTLWDMISVADDDQTLTHTSQIDPGTELFSRYVLFALDLGISHPGNFHLPEDVDFASNGTFGWKVSKIDDRVQFNGHDTAFVRFSAGEVVEREYWLDIDHGAIPLQILDSPKDTSLPKTSVRYDDLRRVANKAWFPFRQTILLGGLVKRLTITEADFERPPDSSIFRLGFPTPSRVIDTVRSCRYPPSQSVFDLDNLPPIGGTGAKPIEINKGPPVAGPVLPGERVARPRWMIWVTYGVGFALLSFVGIQLWRKYRHA